MTRRWELSPAAQRSLAGIVDWTLERFGPRQAEAYEAELIAAFGRMAEGTASGRSCRREWGDAMPEEWRFVRVGSHVVVYEDRSERVLVVDILHGAMDLPRRVGR